MSITATVTPGAVAAQAAARSAVAVVTPGVVVAGIQALQPTATAYTHLRYPWLTGDTIGFSDQIEIERAFEPSFESFGFDEAMVWDIGKAIADTVTMTDTLSQFTFDTLTLLDNVIVGLDMARALADSFSVEDVEPLIGGTSDVNANDVATMLESLAMELSMVASDGVAVTDSLAKELSTLAADTLTLSETTVKDFSKAVDDTITVTEAIVRNLSAVRSDSATPSDAGNWYMQDYVAGDYFAADYVGTTGSF